MSNEPMGPKLVIIVISVSSARLVKTLQETFTINDIAASGIVQWKKQNA
jgi:exosome complex RNA-binding protein Csl4